MRLFSNIMPNFANSLHLLVDCIQAVFYLHILLFFHQRLGSSEFSLYICTVIRAIDTCDALVWSHDSLFLPGMCMSA